MRDNTNNKQDTASKRSCQLKDLRCLALASSVWSVNDDGMSDEPDGGYGEVDKKIYRYYCLGCDQSWTVTSITAVIDPSESERARIRQAALEHLGAKKRLA